MSDAQALPTIRTPWQTYAVLAGGIIAVSMAAIFIRLAQDEGVSSLLIAASRLLIATLVLTPFTLPRYTAYIRQLKRNDWILVVISGLFLALHFILWISSLEHTTVLISVALVNTTPLWSGLLEYVFLRSRLNQLIFLGLIVAITGSIVISLPNGELALGSNPLLGSLLAIAGAITVAVYYVIGRKLRSKLPLFPYIWLVYGLAAIVACLVVLVTRTPVTGYSPQSYIWLAAIALVPQLLGHSSFNYVLGYLSATYVGIATQLEPAVSALMAFFIFREVPRPLQILGSVIILVGVSLASLGQNRST